MLSRYILGSALCIITVVRGRYQPPAEVAEFIDPLHETCTELHGVTDDEVTNYDISNKAKKMMCYMKCLMVESKWAKPDETLNYEVMEQTIHPLIKEFLWPAIEKCREIPAGNEECEKTYNFLACLQKADPVVSFLGYVKIEPLMTV